MPRKPVATLAEFDALDLNEVLDGDQAARRGDREPGRFHSRAYWFGWRAHMMAIGVIPMPPEHLALAEAVRLRFERGGDN
jgi:hypothetical protein